MVGRLQWFGRIIPNHHLGVGPARDVQVLKGVNCCFRGDALRRIGFDTKLRGKGNVSHWELSLCFQMIRAGWRLIYDPAIAVDHHVAVRVDGDTNARGDFERDSYIDMVHNETVSLLDHLPPMRKVAFAAWATLVGSREAPGLAQMPRLAMMSRRPGGVGLVVRKTIASLQGRARGVSTWMRNGKAGSA